MGRGRHPKERIVVVLACTVSEGVWGEEMPHHTHARAHTHAHYPNPYFNPLHPHSHSKSAPSENLCKEERKHRTSPFPIPPQLSLGGSIAIEMLITERKKRTRAVFTDYFPSSGTTLGHNMIVEKAQMINYTYIRPI